MAFTPCTSAGLTANLALNCATPRIKGYEQIGIIILKSDLDLALTTIDATNSRIIRQLTMKSGKKAAVIYNSKNTPLPFNGTQTAYNREADAYDKTVQFYYEGIGGDVSKNAIEPLKDADYVVVLQRKSKYGIGSFQVFGWQKGLSAGNDGGAQVQDEETGYWLITMTTQEPFAEIEWNIAENDNYVDTKTAFDALAVGM